MEGCYLDHFRKTVNVRNVYENGGGYVNQSIDTVREFHLNLSDSNLQNAATTTAHLYKLLARIFGEKQMIRGGIMWDKAYGCRNKYRCPIAYYLMFFLSKSYQMFLDRAVDTPGHDKYVVDGFNTVQKGYLATCLRMRSTPKVDKINSKLMRVYAMTEKGEVSFDKECNHLLDLSDTIGDKGDKKHAKRKDKAHLKHKYYWVHKE